MRSLTPVLCAGLLCGAVACTPAPDQGEAPDSTAAAQPSSAPVPEPASPPASEPAHAVEPNWREDRLALGQETYQQVCAACHQEGVDGAPVTGRREDWADRSQMWQAVLASHAKSGYLDMPSKGGQQGLSDAPPST